MTQSNPYKKVFPISWEEIHRNSKALAWRLLDKGPWKGIIAVTRGGMVPAGIVARELDIRLIETLCISSYDKDDQREMQVLKGVEGDGEGWLVIDDLTDTGGTFRLIKEMMPKAHLACIYVKPKGADTADTFITEFSQDTWVLFPWDMEHQYIEPLADKK